MKFTLIGAFFVAGLCVIATTCSLAFGADNAPATDTNLSSPQADRVAQLIEQLAHRRFAEREAAARALIALGLPTIGPLKQAQNHPEFEIRFRARKILAEVRQRDFHRRLQAFASNQESDEEYDLPGWKAFRDLVGDSRDSRDLFTKMQTDEPRLMQAFEDGPRILEEVLGLRCLQLIQPLGLGEATPISLGSAAAVLFVSCRSEGNHADITAHNVYRICIAPAIHQAMAGSAYEPALREMLSLWITRDGGVTTDYQRLMLALQFDLRAGLAPAVQLLEQPGHAPPLRQQAMIAVAKFGDMSHAPLLERYLTDETQSGARQLPNQMSVQTEMRDVALAALIVLSRQNFAEYGMEHVTTHESIGFVPSSCGFENPAARQAAIEKWRTFRLHQEKNAGKPAKS